ncbi:hypothetical protein [Paraburkholderia humisilvae]|nr:hypothetical protein [Paraburkholderia humisilvae]
MAIYHFFDEPMKVQKFSDTRSVNSETHHLPDADVRLSASLSGRMAPITKLAALNSRAPTEAVESKFSTVRSSGNENKLNSVIKFKDGKRLGRGVEGEVREDTQNEGFVVKEFASRGMEHEAEEQARLFNRFYGEGSAEVFKGPKGYGVTSGNTYLRMLKVPGIPLDSLRKGDLPANSKELYMRLIMDLGDHKIMHSDFHQGNILYDEKAERFWPIDISNAYDEYHTMDKEILAIFNQYEEDKFDYVMREMMSDYLPSPPALEAQIVSSQERKAAHVDTVRSRDDLKRQIAE